MRNAPPPSNEQWSTYVDALVTALDPLEWAGWDVPDAYDSDFDRVHGPSLSGRLSRTETATVVAAQGLARTSEVLATAQATAYSSRASFRPSGVHNAVAFEDDGHGRVGGPQRAIR